MRGSQRGMAVSEETPHQHTDPAAVRVPSRLLQAHQPHPFQLPLVDSICLLACSLGPLASSRVGQQHGGQLTVHIRQLLSLDHSLSYGKGQKGSEGGCMDGVPAKPLAGPEVGLLCGHSMIKM